MASSSKTDPFPNDSKEGPSRSESQSRCSPDDITVELQTSDSNAAVKTQKPGKFRRTALTFLGVRKTICILPSFFVGRSKNLGKWSSKKAIFKSKTHDGLSKVCHEDGPRSGDDFLLDSHRDVHCSCHNKSSPPPADQKSLSLTRHKKGLRGFFQSIKHHKNHKNGIEKSETFALSSARSETDMPVTPEYEQCFPECLKLQPDVPAFEKSIGATECAEDDDEDDTVEKCVSIQDDDPNEKLSLVALVSSDYEGLSRVQSDPCLKLEMPSEPKMKPEVTAGSSDQLNVMFEDVDSLKSFDSLTGCGDIIADQEDDSLTESTVSGERSRNGGKRASCFLTYQGGGEEMAFSEDLDEECLDEMWVNDASEEMCEMCNQDHTDLSSDVTCSHNNADLANSDPKAAADSSIADVATPQSERQESAPNSDEGYYDSTTPGPEEAQEKSERMRSDRLPRDSYSGDALYELFAPDESLISPHHEKKSVLLESEECEYFNKREDFTDSAFLPDINHLQIGNELYEDQSFLEMPSSCSQSNELAQDAAQSHAFGVNKQGNFSSNTKALVNSNMKTNSSVANTEHVKRHSGISFGSASDPDFETFCEPKEEHLEENKPVALPYRNINPQPDETAAEVDEEQAVCFSQALEDFTKHSQMMNTLHNSVSGIDASPAFIPNMEALPAIVTFDVVDMHNEGEYDDEEHMQMDLEEDLSSPYQEFEESYLQKDAFAECDYQMLDPYEQNMLSNTWAIASLPRHLGFTRGSQVLPAPLSHDRRSRSLDTEDLDFLMSDKYLDHREAFISCFEVKKDKGSSFSKKGHHVPLKDTSATSPWQTKSEMALSVSLTNMGVSDVRVGSHNQHSTKTSDLQNTTSLHLCSSTSNSASSELVSSPELYNRQGHLPLHTESILPRSPFYYSEFMEDDGQENVRVEAAVNMLCTGSVKTKPGAREAMSPCSPKPVLSTDQTTLD